jgi:hypothetical protein
MSENTYGIRPDWKKNGHIGMPVKRSDAQAGVTEDLEPMVQFGGIVSDNEDEVERKAIESREGGRKLTTVEYCILVYSSAYFHLDKNQGGIKSYC